MKRFGPVSALDHVDLVVGEGEVVGLVGPNGSGKTTLLRIVAGLARASAGCVVVFGAPAGSRAARRTVAFVPDEPHGLEELTVGEHVGLLRALAHAPEGPGQEAVAALGLESRLGVRVGALSRGLRRRAAVAAAFAAAPGLVLVDEAAATLDAAAVGVVADLLRAHAAGGGAALVAAHDLDFVERACDRVAVLHEGRLVGAGHATLVRSLLRLATTGPRVPRVAVGANAAR